MANPEHLGILREDVELWNAWRRNCPNVLPDLTRANLCEANLAKADLRNVDLYSAKLRAADLYAAKAVGASLHWTDLSEADLSEADLSATDLVGADLRRAKLIGTRLVGANLFKADLRGTELFEAELAMTLLADVDLSEATSLPNVNHTGPSTIGADTLAKTAQGLFKNRARQGGVEAFLRGAGVAEAYIETFHSEIGLPIEFYSCFISYSHKDKTFARRVYDQLQGQGIRCWLDEHAMVPGDDIYDAVDRGIRLSDKILLCCSQSALKDSWWVDDEIAKALQKEQELSRIEGKKVRVLIPLNLDGFMFRPSWTSGYKATLKRRLAADFTGWEKDNAKFEAQFERVVQALRPRSDRG